ncbi:MAG TPA: flagellar basal body P-ring formation chaperone FlgA [Candidatus Binatia bacterium]|jgi:flagella basal body P-ring formation protein FlgA
MKRSNCSKMIPRVAVATFTCAILLVISAPLPGVVMLTPERVAIALQRHAAAYSSWKAENVEVRVLPFQPVSLPEGAPNLRVLRPLNGISPGQQNFLIAAESGGKEHARLWVKAEVRVFAEVVVSSQSLASQEIVKIGDVRLERREVSGLDGRPFYRIDDVVGQQVARSILVNETLTQKRLERPTVLRRGSAVTLLYETGTLRVETPGVAQENGRTGELIQVKNSSSGKLLSGRVLDGRMVRIN